MFCYYFGVLENGNAPAGSDPHDIFVNKNILYRANSVKAAAEKFGKPAAEIESAVVKGKQKLFEYREKKAKAVS